MSAEKVPKIGIMLGPHFVRMAGSFGYMKGYFNDYSSGLIPRPYSLTGVSSGSITASSICPFTQKAFDDNERRLLRLRGSQFYGLNKDLMFWGGIEALGPLLLFLPWEKIKNPILRNVAKGAGVASIESLDRTFIKKLFAANGVFSNRKLKKLMLSSLDFNNIFNSDIKLDIVAANINGNVAKNLNIAPHIVTNYRPEHQDRKILVDGIIKSTSVTGFFPTSQNGFGEFISDGAIYSAFPLEIPYYDHGCDVIVVVEFNYAGLGYLKDNFITWMSAIHRGFGILVDNNSALVLKGFINTNNDLEQIEKIKASMKQLELIAKEVPGIAATWIETEINNCESALMNMTAHGKRFFNLVIIKSHREIPEFNFRNFDEKYIRLSIEIGEETYHNTKEEIHRAIKRVI